MFNEARYRELRALSHDEVGDWVSSRAADVDTLDADGTTLLHHAVDAHSLHVVMALAEAVAEVDQRDRWGNTPLWRAVYHMPESADIARFLFARGADPDAKNNHDVSPRDLATEPHDLWAVGHSDSDPAPRDVAAKEPSEVTDSPQIATSDATVTTRHPTEAEDAGHAGSGPALE